jgi:copper(I)-binding protein
VKNGESVPLTLTVEYADKKRETIDVKAPVRGVGMSEQHKHQH